MSAHRILTTLLSRLLRVSDGEGLVATPCRESVASSEAALYVLHVPFRWVSAFPRYFYRHSVDEVKKEEEISGETQKVWTTDSLVEAVSYLNTKEFRIRTELTDSPEITSDGM
jgi:hypothetical protein